MTHALIIGGTGMLAGVTEALLQRGDHVSLLARRPDRFHPRPADAHRLHRLAADYHDLPRLEAALQSAADRVGQVDLVIAWIHSTSPDAPARVAQSPNLSPGARYVHVLSSASDRPNGEATRMRDIFNHFKHIKYQQVILGFIIEGERSRWLDDEEISAGVWRAILTGPGKATVGVLDPWDSRPR